MKNNLILLVGLISILFSCAGNKQSTGGSSKKKVKQEAAVLSDSVQTAWDKMIAADDKKLKDINRLLDEVSYTKNYDVQELDRLKNLHKSLNEKRYKKQSMTSSQIDAYDLATDSLVRGTLQLVSNTPEMSTHGITNSLITDIQEEDANVIIYRVRYDSWAKRFNEFIDKHQTALVKLGSPYKDYKKIPVFELGTVQN